MNSSPSTDKDKEERRVQFIGLNWSEEEERSNKGAQRRKQTRDRRTAREQERKQQQEEEHKLRLQAIMDREKDLFETLNTFSEVKDESIFTLEYADALFEYVRTEFANESFSYKGSFQLLSILMDNWEDAVQIDSMLDLVKNWETAVVADQNSNSDSGLEQHISQSGNLQPSTDGDSKTSLEYSRDSMDADVRGTIKLILHRANLDKVAQLRSVIKSDISRKGPEINKIGICLFKGLLSDDSAYPEGCFDKLKGDFNVAVAWSKKSMANDERRRHLDSILEDVLKRYHETSIDATPVQQIPQA